MKKNIIIKNALISVFDKTGIIEFSKSLVQKKINLFSTSGTQKILKSSGIKSKNISEYTNIPEILNGRVKTLHHKIYAGILARSEKDQDVIDNYNITQMDLVIINFYPFLETVNKKKLNSNDIIEAIDIGGPTIVRAAAKNYEYITVVTTPNDYNNIIKEMDNNNNKISQKTRLKLAYIALQHVFNYDFNIVKYFSDLTNNDINNNSNILPKYLNYIFKKKNNLIYGENKHQKAGLYINLFQNYNVTQIQGKTLSYNNISDSDIAISCIREFNEPACVIVKHGNPCGAAISKDHYSAYLSAYNSDSTSAFGGIIAFNRTLKKRVAKTIINQQFVELIIAPNITNEALEIFSQKQNLRVLKYHNESIKKDELNIKSINGAFLIQTNCFNHIENIDWKIVSEKKPTEKEICDALFALNIVKYLKSNAVVYVRDLTTISIGAGQTSRIDAIKIAITKANEKKISLKKTIIASDAFFPFRDSIETIANQGTSCIIQPGGSIRDQEIISSVNQYNISMIFTNKRYFKH